MNFIIQLRIGSEVVMNGFRMRDAPIFYGGPPPETGRWRLDISAFESFYASHLKKMDFGPSIETFYLGLEIAELEGWGERFAKTRDYISHRPKMKALISVAQLEWSDVKHKSADAQYDQLGAALFRAVDRILAMKRRPRQFDYALLGDAVRIILASGSASMFELR